MNSSDVNWKKVKEDILGFGVDIYPFEECSLGSLVGYGAAMEVYEGQCKIKMTHKPVAFKCHQRFKMPKLKQRDINTILEDFRHEITLMKKLKYHTNVVQIYGVTFNNEKPILIVELGNETLDKYLIEKVELDSPASWLEKIMLCLDVLRGIRGLHDADIIHGDIKGENILIFTKTTGIATAKISDFGYSSTLTSSKGFGGGSILFMAPEAMGTYPELTLWQKKPMKDIYSFGLLTYQIASDGKIPYGDAEDVLETKTTDRDMKILLASLPEDTPEQFRTIIISTTKFTPTDRVSTDIVEQIIWDFLAAPPSQKHAKRDNQKALVDPMPIPMPMPEIVVPPPTNNIWHVQAKERLDMYADSIGFNLYRNDVNECNFHGKDSPLIWSVQEGDTDVIILLVDQFGANINTNNEDGWTPLHYAASRGCINVMRLLVTRYFADPNTRADNGDTPLHVAAENGHIDVVGLLITVYKVDASAQNKYGTMPLHLAAQEGHVDIVRLLVEEYKLNPSSRDGAGLTPLHYAAGKGQIEVVRLLVVEYKVYTSAKTDLGYTPLDYATKREFEYVDVVRLLKSLEPN